MNTHKDQVEALGSVTAYKYDGADASVLERFENPMPFARSGYHSTVEIVSPEFTSICPKTGQPDFATIRVNYTPRKWCVESKSWKLYLGTFRQHGDFHEACVARIVDALVELLDPELLVVTGEFTPRGGIPFWPQIAYHRALDPSKPYDDDDDDDSV